jgi:hypothetical protein
MPIMPAINETPKSNGILMRSDIQPIWNPFSKTTKIRTRSMKHAPEASPLSHPLDSEK